MHRIPKVWSFYILIILLPIAAYAQPLYIINKPFATQDKWLDSFYRQILSEDSAIVMAKLSKLGQKAKEEGDEQLYLGTKALGIQWYVEKKPEGQLLEKEVEALIADAEKLPAVKAKIMHMYARYLWKAHSTAATAFKYALNAYDIYNTYSEKEFPFKKTYLFELAVNHSRYKDYDGAKTIFLQSLTINTNDDYIGKHNIYNGLALCYRSTSMYDSAVYYFSKGYDYVSAKNDSVWMGIISGNIGITYYLQNKYDKALPLIEKDVAIGIKRNNRTNTAKSMAILGDIYMRKGNIAKGIELVRQSYRIMLETNRPNDYEMLQTIYPIMAKTYAITGNATLAYAYMDSAIAMRDSINKQRNTLILLKTKQQLDAEKLASEMQKAATQKTINTIVRNALIGGIILLAFITILFINRQQIRNRQKQQQLEAAKKLAESANIQTKMELENASIQLADFTRSLRDKNELIEKFADEIARYQSLPCSNELPGKNEALQQLQHSTILTDEQWDDFRKLFEKVHSGYLTRLKDKLPTLSPAETRFITLSKLRFSNKEMAGVLGISNDAVRMNKHRLKKKLEVTEDEDLEKLIDAI